MSIYLPNKQLTRNIWRKKEKRRFVNDFGGDTDNLIDDKNIMTITITTEGKNH